MTLEKAIKNFKNSIPIFIFTASVIGGILYAGEWYGSKKMEFENLKKKDLEIEAKLEDESRELKEECAVIRKESRQHLQDINKRLERIEETIGKVVEYVWQGEGDKCKLVSQRKSQTLDKKKSAKRKKRNDMQQHKRLIASD